MPLAPRAGCHSSRRKKSLHWPGGPKHLSPGETLGNRAFVSCSGGRGGSYTKTNAPPFQGEVQAGSPDQAVALGCYPPALRARTRPVQVETGQRPRGVKRHQPRCRKPGDPFHRRTPAEEANGYQMSSPVTIEEKSKTRSILQVSRARTETSVDSSIGKSSVPWNGTR